LSASAWPGLRAKSYLLWLEAPECERMTRHDSASGTDQELWITSRRRFADVLNSGRPDRWIPRTKWRWQVHDPEDSHRNDRAHQRKRVGLRFRHWSRSDRGEAADWICSGIGRGVRIANRAGIPRNGGGALRDCAGGGARKDSAIHCVL